MPLDQNIIIALAGNPVALTAYIESQTVVPVTPAVGVPVPEPVPAAPITAAPVAPAVVAPVAPAVPTPAVPVSTEPLVVDIPLGNRVDKAKGFSHFSDARNIGDFDYLKGDIRIGKVYVPPAQLVGKQGIVTIQIIVR